MVRARNILVLVLILFAAAQAADAGWMKLAHSVYQATKNGEKHPATLEKVLVVPRDLPEGTLVCISYSNSLEPGGKGKVVGLARHEAEVDGELVVETIKMIAQVNRNRAQRCKEAGPFKAGDVIRFEFEFLNFPNMNGRKTPADWIVAIGSISTNGPHEALLFRQGPKDNKDVPGEGWIQVQDTVFQAEDKNVRHPRNVVGALQVGRKLNADPVLLCMDYANRLPGNGVGRVKVLAEYETGEVDDDGNPVMARARWNRRVKKNRAFGCREIPALPKGSIIVFEFEFSEFKNLRGGKNVHDWFVATLALSTNGKTRSLLFQQPDEGGGSGGGGGGGNGGGGGGGDGGGGGGGGGNGNTNPPAGSQISEADQRQVSKLFRVNGVQLWRPKGDRPGKWVVVGPKTRAIQGNQLDLSTAGFGATINQAVADYERKQGSLGPTGSLLSGNEVNKLNWYSRMNSGSGPTSIRKDRGGHFHAEFYRPGRGSVVTSVPSWPAAIDFFIKSGL